MAGKKLFTNRTPYLLAVTLVVRASEDPRNQAGSKDFMLGAQEHRWEEYGNNIDIYLNGIKLVATYDGQMVAQQYIVILRSSPLDNQLNMRNAVDFGYQNGSFQLSTRQA